MNDMYVEIKFTTESQLYFDNSFIPTLDFQVKLIDNDKVHAGQLTYKFFKKPMASRLSILKLSALRDNVKNDTVTQEFIRRLSNTGILEPQMTVNNKLEDYITELPNSWYDDNNIRRSLLSAIIGYERREAREAEGGQKVHRCGAMIKKCTRFKKMQEKENWYKKELKSTTSYSNNNINWWE